MTSSRYHLAQLNIGRFRAPMDSPTMEGFVSQLDRINALADGSPGFIWRLQDDSGNATGIQAFDDPEVLINLSLWESLDALKQFAYRSDHRQLLKQRGDWFVPMETPYLVLWWVPAGHIPDEQEAVERLSRLEAAGPTEEAFTFAQPFGPPE